MAKKQEKTNQKRISGFRKGADVLQGQQKTGLLRGHWLNVAVLLILYDLAVVNFSYVTALWLRYDFKFSTIDPSYLKAWAGFTPIYTIFCLFVFWRTHLEIRKLYGTAICNRSIDCYSVISHRIYHNILPTHADFLLYYGTGAAVYIYDNDPVLVSLCSSAS